MVKLVDVCVYNDEPVMALRMEYMKGFIDEHIIVCDASSVMADDACYKASLTEAHDYITTKYNDENVIVVVCRADEIPSRSVLQQLRKEYFACCEPVCLQMKSFLFNFNQLQMFPWYGAFCVNDMGMYKMKLTDMRTLFSRKKRMVNAGWHCNQFFSTSRIKRDHDDNTLRLRSANHIEMTGLPPEFRSFHEKLVFLQKHT
jgi:hypothetical protein